MNRERRSLASRFFRFTMRRSVGYAAALAMVSGWTLMLVASGGAMSEGTDLTYVGGGFLLFMAIFAGISRWVAEPAASKILKSHMEAPNPHSGYVLRDEWDAKHGELIKKIDKLTEIVLTAKKR